MTEDDYGVEPEVFFPVAEVARLVRAAVATGVVIGFLSGGLASWMLSAVDPRPEIAVSSGEVAR